MVYRNPVEPHRDPALTVTQDTTELADETRAFIGKLLGEPPREPALWLEALTHGSTGEPRNYERLEFLGDRVLGLVIAEWLHERARDNE